MFGLDLASTAFSDASAGGFVSDVLVEFGHVILTMGIVHLGHEVSALAPQGRPAPEQVADGTPCGGRDIRRLPRRRVAIWCASRGSFLAGPPHLAFIERACTQTKDMPA